MSNFSGQIVDVKIISPLQIMNKFQKIFNYGDILRFIAFLLFAAKCVFVKCMCIFVNLIALAAQYEEEFSAELLIKTKSKQIEKEENGKEKNKGKQNDNLDISYIINLLLQNVDQLQGIFDKLNNQGINHGRQNRYRHINSNSSKESAEGVFKTAQLASVCNPTTQKRIIGQEICFRKLEPVRVLELLRNLIYGYSTESKDNDYNTFNTYDQIDSRMSINEQIHATYDSVNIFSENFDQNDHFNDLSNDDATNGQHDQWQMAEKQRILEWYTANIPLTESDDNNYYDLQDSKTMAKKLEMLESCLNTYVAMSNGGELNTEAADGTIDQQNDFKSLISDRGASCASDLSSIVSESDNDNLPSYEAVDEMVDRQDHQLTIVDNKSNNLKSWSMESADNNDNQPSNDSADLAVYHQNRHTQGCIHAGSITERAANVLDPHDAANAAMKQSNQLTLTAVERAGIFRKIRNHGYCITHCHVHTRTG